jgi:hypothetical protein
MTSQDMLQGFAQIAQQMETVGDLHRIGCALASSFGVSTRSVTTDHFRWGVVVQPLGNGVGLAIGQKIHYSTPLQIAKNGAVALSLAPRPIVDAQHARRNWNWLLRHRHAS